MRPLPSQELLDEFGGLRSCFNVGAMAGTLSSKDTGRRGGGRNVAQIPRRTSVTSLSPRYLGTKAIPVIRSDNSHIFDATAASSASFEGGVFLPST